MKRTLRIVVISILTVGLLAVFLWNSNPGRVWQLIRATELRWLAVALLCNFLALLCRALRWRTILDPDHPPPLYPTFFATVIGFMSSAILPIRAGDLVRPALLSRRTNIRFSTAFGTVLCERVFDLLAILTLFSTFVLATLADPGDLSQAKVLFIRSAGIVGGVILASLLSFILAMHFFRSGARGLHEWLSRYVPQRFRSGWMSFFDSFVASLSLVRSPAVLARVALLTSAIWFFLCSEFFWVMRAMDKPLPFMASFFVTGMVILGFSIPTPGGIGGFHKICQLVLTTFYDLDVDLSVAVALVFHVVGVAPVIVTGLVLLVREGLSIRQLAQIGENIEE